MIKIFSQMHILLVVGCLIAYNASCQEFTDTFEEGKNEKWQVYEGNWRVIHGKYIMDKKSGYSLTKACAFREFNYEAEISIGKTGRAGLLFNVCSHVPDANPLNGYYAAIDASNDSIYLYKVRIEKKDIHTKEFTKIIAIAHPIDPNTPYQLKISKQGSLIEFFLNKNQVVSIYEKSFTIGSIGVMAENTEASIDNILVSNLRSSNYNWSWVKGAIYVPTNCVNQIQQWEEFDARIADRELRYASVYGFNTIRIYLHYLVYEKDKVKFLKDLETFLQIADKHNLKVVISFFDDVWDGEPHLGPQLKPVLGQHNKRWAQCPGNKIKENYPQYKDKLKSYVQDVVNQYAEDSRVLFWEPYNEPGFLMKGKYLEATKVLLNDSRIWIKETGTKIPITSTADPDFIGKDFSDFYSWHSYTRSYEGPQGPDAINTECMNRIDQTLAGIIDNYGRKQTGFIIWELGIGRTNSRFCWISPKNSPEPSMPFQGFLYPDGHPWDTNEVALLRGKLDDLPVFNVSYFTGNFELEKKWSFTPSIDFELGNESGTGSPDASIGIDKDNFSIRWTGQVKSRKKGNYTFYIDSDHIARMWMNGKLIIDKNSDKDEEVKTTIPLEEEKLYDIKIEYFHLKGDSRMHVYWDGPEITKEVLPGRRALIKADPITKESMFSTE